MRNLQLLLAPRISDLLTTIIVLISTTSTLQATDYIWKSGAGSPTDPDPITWEDPNHWTPTGVPGKDDQASIGGCNDPKNVKISSDVVVKKLVIEQSILNGSGNLTVMQSFTGTAVSTEGTGVITIADGATSGPNVQSAK